MSQKIEKIEYCPVGHSSKDFAYTDLQNFIYEGNVADVLKNILSKNLKLGLMGMPTSIRTSNKWHEHKLIRKNVALKEIQDSRYDIIGFLKVAWSLQCLHEINLVYCNLHSGNILMMNDYNHGDSIEIDLSSLLRRNEFTKKGDIYSFGGIIYEIVTTQRPFADQVHDTYLMIDICNGVRPKVPDFMLNWIPEWYLNLMHRCWSDNPSERPSTYELVNLFWDISDKLYGNIVDNDVIRSIHTLHGLQDLLKEIKSGKSPDPNILKFNESTTSNSVDSKESLKFIDEESKFNESTTSNSVDSKESLKFIDEESKIVSILGYISVRDEGDTGDGNDIICGILGDIKEVMVIFLTKSFYI
ncbi:hypothetical protein Glove_527g7 [Diversispora epigaea]|uniref:Protein kinase domain-containing protein n=1 Tax=Diversispora epigaea TaxID=1348612 RepID=A0A397GIG3_9GLOM|nr:hypothetical protein Glove_527g7 [Diversispora epigaea]